MNYLILTETDFFALIDESGKCNLEAAYGDFVQTVISLCSERADSDTAAVVLLYTEIELQYHRTLHSEPGESHADLYVRKALSCPSATTVQSLPRTERNNRRQASGFAMDGQHP